MLYFSMQTQICIMSISLLTFNLLIIKLNPTIFKVEFYFNNKEIYFKPSFPKGFKANYNT